jgi:hypothetical protein
MTCNSFWADEGTGTGATGAEGPLGAAQHAMAQQCRPARQHDFAAGEAPDIATIGCAARINPSSNAPATLMTFKPMPFPCSCSFQTFEPDESSHIGQKDATPFLFFFMGDPSGPQSVIRHSGGVSAQRPGHNSTIPSYVADKVTDFQCPLVTD